MGAKVTFNELTKTIEIDDKNSKVQAYRNGGVIAYFAAEAQAVIRRGRRES